MEKFIKLLLATFPIYILGAMIIAIGLYLTTQEKDYKGIIVIIMGIFFIFTLETIIKRNILFK